jgi:membrane protease YdiL (CAAX protease family)
MTEFPKHAWNPPRRTADPLIATLILLILLLVGEQARLRRARPAVPDSQVSLEGRIEDLSLSAPRVLGPMLGRQLPRPSSFAQLAGRIQSPWDRAILAVQLGEEADPAAGADLARALPGPAGPAFEQAWNYAYAGTGTAPGGQDLQRVQQALGQGYSARILEARVVARSGADAAPFERAARQWLLPRLAGLVAAGLGGLLLALAGLAFGLQQALAMPAPRPELRFAMSGRALLLVLLGWFLGLLAAGPVVGTLVVLAPFLRPIALPLVYGFHASLGLAFLCAAEGTDLASLWRRLTPGRVAPALAKGLGFFALAFAAVMAVALLISPLLRHSAPPQKELLEMLANLRGPVAVLLVFLTVAVVAPVFEEILFRGFLLPWLGERLERRLGRTGWPLAILLTGLTFAAIHMQPMGLPTLGTLGVVLGFAFVRTGHLGSAILVHGLWNGGVFIFMRLLT